MMHSQLPRDRNGIPVTWASAWSSELNIEVRCEPLLAPLMGEVKAYFSTGTQYQGEPRVTLPNPDRVRRSVLQGLCQVCGSDLEDGPRLVCDIRLGDGEFRVGKRMVPLLIDAWTCNGCIDFSLANCPNLKRRNHLDVLLVKEWLPVPTLERPKWIPDSVPYGPIGFVKIAALDYEIWSGNGPI